MENNVVSVMLWGEEVGKLYWDERNKRAVFNYHPDFIRKGVEIAPTDRFCQRIGSKGYAHPRKQRKDLSRSPSVFGRFIA